MTNGDGNGKKDNSGFGVVFNLLEIFFSGGAIWERQEEDAESDIVETEDIVEELDIDDDDVN